MKYALKLARHGSIFLAQVAWIGMGCVLDFILLLISSREREGSNNLAGPEVSDGLNRSHSNYDLDWGWQESETDQK